jgi:hypothetical protein
MRRHLADVGKSVPVERGHDNARWNLAARLGLYEGKESGPSTIRRPEVKKLTAGAAPISLIDNRL